MEEIFGKYKDIIRRKPDLTKAKALLGYYPRTNMEEAIKKVIKHRLVAIEEEQEHKADVDHMNSLSP